MKRCLIALVAALVFATFAPCFGAPEGARSTPALNGDPKRPAAARWVRSELYFSTGLVDSPREAITEEDWRAFLDREVTPRFPDGLTVFDAYGQWLSRATNSVGHLRTKVLVILHEDTPKRRTDIDAIRLAWKTATHAQSVLLATQAVDVSF